MKPYILVPIIVGSALLLTGGVVLAIGISNQQNLKTVSNTYEITDAFSDIKVDVSSAKVNFYVSEDSSVKVIYEGLKKDAPDASVKDNIFTITQNQNKKWYEYIFSFDWFVSRKFSIYLPSGEYENLNIKLSSGDLTMPKDFTFRSVNVKVSSGSITSSASSKNELNYESSSGKINISDVTAKTMNIKTSSGSVTLSNANISDDINIGVSSGKVVLSDVSGANLDVKTSSGSITLKNTVITNNIKAKVSSGSVYFEDSDAETLDIEVSSGSVSGTLLSSHIFSAHSSSGRVNVPETTEGGLCRINVSSGSINITIKNP